MVWLQNAVILTLKLILLLQLIAKFLVLACNSIIFRNRFLDMTTMASKEKITVFHRKLREFSSSFDQVLKKFISILLLKYT